MSRTWVCGIKLGLALAFAALIVPQLAFAQEHAHTSSSSGHAHLPANESSKPGSMPATEFMSEHEATHGVPSETKRTPDAVREDQNRDAMASMKTGSMPGMNMDRMQGGKAPPDARDPHAYSGGLKRQPMHGMEMADDELFGSIAFNELEYVDSRRGGHGQALDMEAWYGGDYNKLWFKAEGERRKGHLESMRTEVLWDRVFATFWSSQLGFRHDTGEGSTRSWLAIGLRGVAPYWVHVDATAYVGTHGALAARAEARYDLLLTQCLVLQPKIEMNLYSKNDESRGLGSGLSDAELGLRLRYEIRRQFAPYVGVVWKRLYGNTADYARQAGEKSSDTEYVAGVRLWF